MTTIKDHGSDVYGLSFHPERPFVFASSSRDTTIRFFTLDGLISSLKTQLLSDDQITNVSSIYEDPKNVYTKK